MTKVSKVAEKLGTSRNTIYRKIKELSLESKGHVTKKNRVTTIDNKGIELIERSLNIVKDVHQSDKNVVIQSDDISHQIFITEQFQQLVDVTLVSLKDQIKQLEQQLIDKDKIIEDLRKDKNKLMQMHENNQILLAREQEQRLMLEQTTKKGFWDRFKKVNNNEK